MRKNVLLKEGSDTILPITTAENVRGTDELNNFLAGNMKTIYVITIDGNLFVYSYYADNDNWTWEDIYNDRETRSTDFENMVINYNSCYLEDPDKWGETWQYLQISKEEQVIPGNIYYTSDFLPEG